MYPVETDPCEGTQAQASIDSERGMELHFRILAIPRCQKRLLKGSNGARE